MCDALTVEADSGGHTDNRPLVCLLPAMLALRDELQAKHGYDQLVRVGGGGGIGTPAAALAAFMLGADYVVTGSVNQACVEAGASAHTEGLLAKAGQADVMMAPSADMFEMGVKVQVLKRGTLFPVRAQKLYELYKAYDSLEGFRRRSAKNWKSRSSASPGNGLAGDGSFLPRARPRAIGTGKPKPQAQDGAGLPLVPGVVVALVDQR